MVICLVWRSFVTLSSTIEYFSYNSRTEGREPLCKGLVYLCFHSESYTSHFLHLESKRTFASQSDTFYATSKE